MLILHCPCCGEDAAEIDLVPGGEAHLKREGPGSSDEALEDYLFTRDNPKGVVLERWRHAYGCGKWFLAARSSVTMEVYGTYAAQTHAPPQDLQDHIAERTGEA
ncbi:sarcosine oxidase subunit delta [Salipiger pallidus]|uniref:Sarcosine oxidase subunit delta n=1 Tax=Salipiger pallidus TaxID=1775170 RepID=A0A8J2ZMS9_9RHOB|nr:sarcosine oxidase subunit delta [Salipiger pallidus]GGG82706.1 sarcosine oxidase subunit delta [Salipiger pallidus]